MRKISILVIGIAISGLAIGEICHALSKYHGKEAQCLADSHRSGIGAVQYACQRAARTSNNGCSLWLGSASSSTVPTIYASSPTAIVSAAFWGMCTDYADTTRQITVKNDNNAINDGMNLTRGLWNNPRGIATTINLGLFLPGATRTESDCATIYKRDIIVGRYNGETGDYNEMTETITVKVPKNGSSCDDDGDDLCRAHPEWGTLVSGTTSTVIKIKNSELLERSGGAAGNWSGSVYAKPTDRVAWHSCYFPGVQAKAYEWVSLVTGNYYWKGYQDLPTTSCASSDYPVQVKQLYQVATPWNNNYTLANSANLSSRSPSGASMGNQAPGGNYPTGDQTVRQSHNEANTVPTDAGGTITESSTTSSPIKAVISSRTLDPKSIYGGTCYQKSNNVDKAKIDDEHEYVLCPSTATFKDTNGNYFNSSYPDILGYVPEVPAVGETPKVDAYYCWKVISGKTKSCKDCNGDPNCMNNLNCNTCNGNSDCTGDNCCTCNGDYHCFQCMNKYVGADSEGKRTIQVANVTRGPSSKSASVTVPYNYTIDTGVSIESRVVYAGETVTLSDVWTSVGTRYNGLTYDEYATIVPSAKIALAAYITSDSSGGTSGREISNISDLCSTINGSISDSNKKPKQCTNVLTPTSVGSLNRDGNLSGSSDSHIDRIGGRVQSIMDASAGDWLCYVSAVWPTASNGNADTSSGGNNRWRYSNPECVQIAKKPSFQVWGGDMYSSANVESSVGEKRNVYNAYYSGWKNLCKGSGANRKCFTSNSGASFTSYGSWVEEGLILGGSAITKTVSSGASTGTNGDSQKAFAGNTGTLCANRAPLSFSNICNNANSGGSNQVGKSGIDGGAVRRELIDYWVNNPGGAGVGTPINLSNPNQGTRQESATGANIRYLAATSATTTINASTIPQGTTFLLNADGKNITIAGNIKYQDGYRSLDQIPKLIIYANNINISCDVGEIDAILIATGNVDTCSTAGDINAQNRSKQLKIVGVVIAGHVDLGRTYGQAAWNGSGTNGQQQAAEIFDYDSTMLMWSEYMSGSAETDTLQSVYQHEVAPRY